MPISPKLPGPTSPIAITTDATGAVIKFKLSWSEWLKAACLIVTAAFAGYSHIKAEQQTVADKQSELAVKQIELAAAQKETNHKVEVLDLKLSGLKERAAEDRDLTKHKLAEIEQKLDGVRDILTKPGRIPQR